MSTQPTATAAEWYIVTFKFWEKRGARRRRSDGHSAVMACSASEAIGIVSKRWEGDVAAAWEFCTAKSMRAIEDEAELRRQEKAYANSPAGQAAAGAAALERIRAARLARGAK